MNTSLAIGATIVAGFAAAAAVLWFQYGPNSNKDPMPATRAAVRRQLLLIEICAVAFGLEVAVFASTRSLVWEAFVVAGIVLPSGGVLLRTSFRELPTPQRSQATTLLVSALIYTVVFSMLCFVTVQEVLTKPAADASAHGPLAFALELQGLALYPFVIFFTFARFLTARKYLKPPGV